jgi:branched-chain amino acid transport system permease protein
MIAMYALTQTPLGRMVNAVRDNPERAEFVGYDTQKLRFLQLALSGFFAGVSGALACINFEIVSAENVSALRSGGVLLAVFIGGAPFFFGPILGAVVFILFVSALSNLTSAWQLYLGLFFLVMVLYAPGGIASLIMMQVPAIRAGRFREMLGPYLLAALAAALTLCGLAGLVELVYHVSDTTLGSSFSFAWIRLDSDVLAHWIGFALLFVAGFLALRYATRFVGARWAVIQADLRAKNA